MTELIEKVKEAKKVLDNSQKELLNWCRDTSAATLDQRFDVWSKYVDGYNCCIIYRWRGK